MMGREVQDMFVILSSFFSIGATCSSLGCYEEWSCGRREKVCRIAVFWQRSAAECMGMCMRKAQGSVPGHGKVGTYDNPFSFLLALTYPISLVARHRAKAP